MLWTALALCPPAASTAPRLAASPSCSIQRNRERLLALGIPSLAKALDETVGAAAAAVKRKPGAAAKKKPKKPRGAEAGAEERPTRRQVLPQWPVQLCQACLAWHKTQQGCSGWREQM